ncbi:MAG: fumarylacetoacetate hydrolase family protein [Clostridia bacterium]
MRIVRVMVDNERFYAVMADKLMRLSAAPYEGFIYDGRQYDIAEATLLAPAEPSKLVCIGKNYWAHAQEMNEGSPDEPLLFIKPNTCVIGHNGVICYPEISRRVDYEGELAVVIGSQASNVQAGHAAQYIFGYTCANDVTARDIQKGDKQWTRGKGFDTFCPIGPWIETELDAQHAHIITRLNGEIRQDSNTLLMTHSIDKLICYITQCMTLLPGDIVLTGTPEGIGPMQRGDTVEVEIEGIGVLQNTI